MMKKRNLKDIPLESALNGTVHKKILVRGEEASSGLAFLQEAYLAPKTQFEPHTHPELEEYFYFLNGQGTMRVGDHEENVAAGDRVIVPVGQVHSVTNTGDAAMTFIAAGVKIKAP
jgi:mannose-6-phosphate isomerase-like protein (cupin superfamily)